MEFSEEQCWRQIEALGFYLAVWATIWQWYCEDWMRVRNINKIIAMDIRCLERHYLLYWFTNMRSDKKKKKILKNILFLHKRWGQVTAQLLGNMATKDMVWKYLLCTSLQDVQKIQWNSRNFSNPKIILQCFKFGAQESKRIARFAMCWMFCVFLNNLNCNYHANNDFWLTIWQHISSTMAF